MELLGQLRAFDVAACKTGPPDPLVRLPIRWAGILNPITQASADGNHVRPAGGAFRSDYHSHDTRMGRGLF